MIRETLGGRRVLWFLLLLSSLSSCSSISGHKVIECNDGSGSVRLQDVGGLPIVVKTPTTAIFIVTESTYTVERMDPTTSGGVTTVRLPDETETTISQQPILLGPYDVYTIDTLRPASGSLDYEISLTDQYPTAVKGKVVDSTINDVGKVVGDLIDKLGTKPAGVQKQSGANITKTLRRTSIRMVQVDLRSGQIEVKDLSSPADVKSP